MAEKKFSKKKKVGFGGTILDLGAKHAEGMEDNPESSLGGSISDMGSKDAVGVGKGK
jgi:hypothetical protein